MQIDLTQITPLLKWLLSEDIGSGDVTSNLLMPPEAAAEATLVARKPLVVCGIAVAAEVFRALDENISCELLAKDGERVEGSRALLKIAGSARSILAAERTALNLLQRMCGVATLSRQAADMVAYTGVTLLDTRKTMPGLRIFDKYATSTGGVKNHRMRLDDMILIKDNHIAVVGGVTEAVERAKNGNQNGLAIVVECDDLEQVAQAIASGADRILLDNMPPEMIRKAVELARGGSARPESFGQMVAATRGSRVKLEASGGINMANLCAYAETGVDFISLGFITHSAPAVDIGLDIDFVRG